MEKKGLSAPWCSWNKNIKKIFILYLSPSSKLYFPQTFPSLNATTTDSVAQVLKLGSYLCLFFLRPIFDTQFINIHKPSIYCCPSSLLPPNPSHNLITWTVQWPL